MTHDQFPGGRVGFYGEGCTRSVWVFDVFGFDEVSKISNLRCSGRRR